MKQSLKERIAASTKVQAPSMIPVEPEEKVKRESEVLPDIQEVITSPVTRLNLLRLIEAEAGWKIQESEAKKARKPIKASIKRFLGQTSYKFMCHGNRVAYFNAPRKEISAELLLTNGVSPAVIAKSTVTKDSWTLKVTPPGMEEEPYDD